jgi:CDP-diacylglycerol--glycerol-3-phosphate 3-phosphatidyltransferase
MIANTITLIRIALTFIVVGLLNVNFHLSIAMFILILVIMMLDWLDGFIARKFGEATRFGALFDIAGDRIVENIFWIYFAVVRLTSFWVPMIVISRGLLTDLVRAMAFAKGRTPFGQKTMMDSAWARLLVASRPSRGIYNGLKIAAFCYLAALLVVARAPWRFGAALPGGWLYSARHLLVYTVVLMCVVRGFPVIWDGRRYLLEKVQ